MATSMDFNGGDGGEGELGRGSGVEEGGTWRFWIGSRWMFDEAVEGRSRVDRERGLGHVVACSGVKGSCPNYFVRLEGVPLRTGRSDWPPVLPNVRALSGSYIFSSVAA